jgi:outer membrane lipase/esterase
MTAKLTRAFLFLSATLIAGVFATTTSAAKPTTIPLKNMYVLGDSLSDEGNLFLATSEIGPAFNVPPLPDANHYFAGRFSNGENYAGQLAKMLGFTLGPSLAGGNNFAFGGARTTYNTVEPPSGPFPVGAFPWSLDLERQAFLDRVAPRGADPTTLYVVFSGSNDIADILARRLDPATTIATTVNGIRDVILAFRSVGARHILVPNVPNLGVVPSVTRLGPAVAALATNLSIAYNVALAAMLDQIDQGDIIRFNTFDLINAIIAQPLTFGFTNVTQPCYTGFVEPDPSATECATPDIYAFWDVEHPTAALHAVIANAIFESALHCEVKGHGNKAKESFVAHCAIN